MYCRCGHESVVTDSPPETGASWTEEEALNVLLCPSEGSNSHCDARTLSQSDRGVDKTDFRFPFSPFRLSHATRRAECGGNGREDGDYDVEDLAPSAVVVKCSHSLVRGPTLTCPRVAMGIAPLMEHRLTFSQSFKDSIRPVWRGRGSRDACARRGDKVGFVKGLID